MFALIADLVRGWGLPWSGAGFLIIGAIIIFVFLRVTLYLTLYLSYLLVCSIRWANCQLPGLIYSAEVGVYQLRERLKAALWVSFILVGAWTWLYLDRTKLEGEHLIGLERKVTAVVANWVGSGPDGSR
jgi:hypothetical protein